MPVLFCDGETDGHDFEESRLGQRRARRPEIIADGEFQLIGAGLTCVAGQQRPFAPSIRVRPGFDQQTSSVAFKAEKPDRDAFGRTPGSDVEDMGGQARHGQGTPLTAAGNLLNSPFHASPDAAAFSGLLMAAAMAAPAHADDGGDIPIDFERAKGAPVDGPALGRAATKRTEEAQATAGCDAGSCKIVASDGY
jgi:hypothetical protein